MTEIIPQLEYVTIKRSEYDYLRAVVEGDAAKRSTPNIPRDPTPEMLVAGRKQCAADCLGPHLGPNVERIWQVMHDTARGDNG